MVELNSVFAPASSMGPHCPQLSGRFEKNAFVQPLQFRYGDEGG
jgi:hypothetical protein